MLLRVIQNEEWAGKNKAPNSPMTCEHTIFFKMYNFVHELFKINALGNIYARGPEDVAPRESDKNPRNWEEVKLHEDSQKCASGIDALNCYFLTLTLLVCYYKLVLPQFAISLRSDMSNLVNFFTNNIKLIMRIHMACSRF